MVSADGGDWEVVVGLDDVTVEDLAADAKIVKASLGE